MSVATSISLNKVQQELDRCREYGEKCGWLISEIDESNQSFTVTMTSPIDQEKYILEVCFSDYPELPLILDFIEPISNNKGSKNAFPKNDDSFFHPAPCICNPCSRKSYKAFNSTGPHQDWQMIGWKENPKVATLKSVDSILRSIYSRISNKNKYHGRMA